MKKILPVLIAVIAAFGNLQAQLETELARVNITNKLLTTGKTYEFDLRLIRIDENRWKRWADGTFQFSLSTKDTNGINYRNLSIELVKDAYNNDITDLPALLAGPGDMRQAYPVVEYHVTPEIIPNGYVPDTLSQRISITVAGPDTYTNAVDVPFVDDSADGILIGRFRIATIDGSDFPDDLDINWLQPVEYYQACAYKRPRTDDVVPWHNFDPNIEMKDFNLKTTVTYDKDNKVDTCFIVRDFEAAYEGYGRVSLRWITDCEVQNQGFLIYRGMVPFGATSLDQVVYQDTVGDFQRSAAENTMLKGLGTAKPGKDYLFEYDTVNVKGEEYCYKLYNKDINGNLHERATTCLYIPNTVISFATAIPTVFSTKTQIKYKLEEDVYLTVFITDINGKRVQDVYKSEKKDRGWYTDLYFEPDIYAQQGLYEVIFIAVPRYDIGVEVARAVVKTQYVK